MVRTIQKAAQYLFSFAKIHKKELIINGCATVGCAVAAFLLFRIFYRDHSPSMFEVLKNGSIAIFLLGITSSVSSILTASSIIFLGAWGLGLFIFSVFFGLQLEYVVAMALVWLGLWGTYVFLRKEYEERLALRGKWLYLILTRGIPFQMTLFSLLVAMSYYVSPQFGITQTSFQIPQPFVERALSWFPEDIRFPISSPDLSLTVADLTDIQRQKLEETLGHTLQGDATLSTTASEMIWVRILAQMKNRIKFNEATIFPPLFILGIFLLVRTFTIPIAWAVGFFSTFLVQLLIYTGFVEIKKIQREKEIISL